MNFEVESREGLVDAIAGERDKYPRRPDDMDSEELVDALLASGVVTIADAKQVTTPTETDESLLATYETAHSDAFIREPESDGGKIEREAHLAALRAVVTLASRPALVAPPTEEWEDPEPWVDLSTGNRHSDLLSPILAIVGKWEHKPRTREQYEADQKPVVPLTLTDEQADILTLTETFDSFDALSVPVDALGFPTQEGATFRARKLAPAYFTVVEPGMFEYRGGGFCEPQELDHTSIEDVRPADGRGGQ